MEKWQQYIKVMWGKQERICITFKLSNACPLWNGIGSGFFHVARNIQHYIVTQIQPISNVDKQLVGRLSSVRTVNQPRIENPTWVSMKLLRELLHTMCGHVLNNCISIYFTMMYTLGALCVCLHRKDRHTGVFLEMFDIPHHLVYTPTQLTSSTVTFQRRSSSAALEWSSWFKIIDHCTHHVMYTYMLKPQGIYYNAITIYDWICNKHLFIYVHYMQGKTEKQTHNCL